MTESRRSNPALPAQVAVADTPEVRATLDRLIRDRAASRLASGDTGLWIAAARAEARERLGWLSAVRTARPLLPELAELRAELAAEGVTDVVLCGMGGNALAARAIAAAAQVPLTVLDTTHPDAVHRVLGRDLRHTAVVVSSKSGHTTETDALRRTVGAALAAQGLDHGARTVAVTDPGSALAAAARRDGYRRTFLAPPDVGGRYTALTAYGLVPAALAGADPAPLLESAEALGAALPRDARDNPALLLTAALTAAPECRTLVMTGPGTEFLDWVEQLVAESTGKLGRGLLPVVVEPGAPEVAAPPAGSRLFLTAPHPAPDPGPHPAPAPGPHPAVDSGGLCGTDGATAPAPVSSPAPMAAPAPADQEAAGPRPWCRSTGQLGALFLLWETATALAGHVLDVNPFDQPDVEEAKRAALSLLGDPQSHHEPVTGERLVTAHGDDPGTAAAGSPGDAVRELVRGLRKDQYLAVLAYADPWRDAGLAGLRRTLSELTRRPVTFGWGPRYLHSTGQYHKGGPSDGVFLQIVVAGEHRVPVPGLPHTFGELMSAQAAGDAALHRGRSRLLTLRVTGGERGVAALVRLVGALRPD